MLFSGITVAFIIGVGLDDRGLRELFPDQVLHPIPGDDIGSVLLPGMELDPYLAGETRAHSSIDLL